LAWELGKKAEGEKTFTTFGRYKFFVWAYLKYTTRHIH
jgi:hypothetical protein